MNRKNNAMNKRGQIPEQLMFGSFFILLMIILGGIVWGSTVFFGSGYDSRQADAMLLNSNIQNCLLNSGVGKLSTSDGFYKTCNINQQVVENNKIMIKICEKESIDECIGEQNPVFSAGSNFQACKFVGAQNNKAYPKCAMYGLLVNGKIVSVITGSNQQISTGASK